MSAGISLQQHVEEPKLLRQRMAAERRKWQVSTSVYGIIYIGIRVILIVSSAILAADKSLDIGVKLAAGLALTITILTTVDTWMKPREKWRGFMGDRDELEDLIIRGDLSADDHEAVEKLRIDFLKLRQQHREKNVY